MNLTASLAHSQLKTNYKRTIWTLLGIALSTAMITAVFGFAASAIDTIYEVVGGNLRDVYVTTFSIIGVILSTVIMAASIIVVSNAFRISAGERLAHGSWACKTSPHLHAPRYPVRRPATPFAEGCLQKAKGLDQASWSAAREHYL